MCGAAVPSARQEQVTRPAVFVWLYSRARGGFDIYNISHIVKVFSLLFFVINKKKIFLLECTIVDIVDDNLHLMYNCDCSDWKQ